MAAFRTASRAHRKGTFLRAFARIGRIGAAARASRISRDAIHDWRRADPVFRRAFLVAKSEFHSTDSEHLRMHADFFLQAIRPHVAPPDWPATLSAVHLAVANRMFKTQCNDAAALQADRTSRDAADLSGAHIARPACACDGTGGIRRPL